MLSTEVPIVTVVSPLQFENALMPILVTELGIVSVVNPHDINASFPMLVIVLV